jgi:Protein of unknown function (DUF3703)
MKLSLTTKIDLSPETVWAEVQTAALLVHVAWPLVRFVPVGDTPLDAFKPGGRYLVSLRLFGFLPFGRQWIVTSLHEPETGIWPKKLRDNGHSALINKWDHWITVATDGDGGTHYTDALEVGAGLMTPFIWLFAQIFYRHRQRRWRALARTLHMRRLIDAEMTTFEAARAGGQITEAWQALERAHIIAQPYLGPHVANHWSMLKFAVALRQPKEIIGQAARLVLAPLGALTGRIPIGNTGRSNVSAFWSMPINAELLAKIEQAKMGR